MNHQYFISLNNSYFYQYPMNFCFDYQYSTLLLVYQQVIFFKEKKEYFDSFNNIFVWPKYLKEHLGLMGFQIDNGAIKSFSYHDSLYDYALVLNYIKKVSIKFNVDNTFFFFFRSDTVEHTISNNINIDILNLPFFKMSKKISFNSLEQNMLMIPDAYMIDPIKRSYINYSLTKDIDFLDKIGKGIFRGSTTGNNCLFNILAKKKDQCPRLKLIMQSQYCSGKVDAEFSSVYSEYKNETYLSICCNYKTLTEHLNYKFIVSQDGHSSSFMRIPFAMQSHSLLIKQEEATVQWFYHALKPYYNYIPISDSTNICFYTDYLNLFPSRNINIVENSNYLSRNIFTVNSLLDYTASILNEYSKISKDYNSSNQQIPPLEHTLLKGEGLNTDIENIATGSIYFLLENMEQNNIPAILGEYLIHSINEIGDGWV